MTTTPDMPNIGDVNLPTLLRRVKIAIPLGLVVFVLGAVVILERAVRDYQQRHQGEY
jgi:hypothetical protein